MRLFAIASVCLTVQSTRSPGDGCCMDTSNGFSLTHTFPFHPEIFFIPEGAQCEDELSGIQANQREGNMYQSYSANCLMDDGVTTYRSVGWDLVNGSSGSATIIYHANGTVEADCDMYMSTQLKSSDPWPSNCFGPKYNDDMAFEGIVTYGSLRAERYKITKTQQGDRMDWMRNAFMDIDVDNGCMPIRMGQMTITNLDNSDPPDSRFAIPPECFQHGAKATGPVMHPKGILWSLKAMRSSSVV